MPSRQGTAPRHSSVAQLVNVALRKVSARLVLLSETAARCVGLHPTDLHCLDLLQLDGPMTASALARQVGLTTGAITAVIDRLERAGLVRRERIREDRRRVLIHVNRERVKSLSGLYKPLGRRMTRVDDTFSDEQLETVLAYLEATLAAFTDHVNWLTARAGARRAAGPGRGGSAHPRGGPGRVSARL
ncbi:MAG TPA: MarR family transcriptional regulator [Vicinamibacterales bacterium]|nr:MarR family transcriptional regulator [Vicinamibacterales bacterium]